MCLISRSQHAEVWDVLLPSYNPETVMKARSCVIWSSIRIAQITVPIIVYSQTHLLNVIYNTAFNTECEISLALLVWVSHCSNNFIKPLIILLNEQWLIYSFVSLVVERSDRHHVLSLLASANSWALWQVSFVSVPAVFHRVTALSIRVSTFGLSNVAKEIPRSFSQLLNKNCLC